MKQNKTVRVSEVLTNNMSTIANCIDVTSLKSEVVKVIKDNYDSISDKEAADKLLKIVSTARNKSVLFSTLVTYITNIKVATVD